MVVISKVFELFVSNSDVNDKIDSYVSSLLDAFNQAFRSIQKLPIEGFIEAYSSFLLVKNFYPPCLHFSTDQHLKVIDLLQCNNIKSVESIIFDVYNDHFVYHLYSEWCNIVKTERQRIIKEAIDCYFDGKYHACNALFLSQFSGIINDNQIELTSDEFINFSDRLDELSYAYQKGKYISKDKRIVERHFLVNLQGSLFAFSRYFIDYIYSSDKVDSSILSNVANRNKVLHGEDCSFGTKIKALKTIICIDILIKLPNIQKKLWEHNNG